MSQVIAQQILATLRQNRQEVLQALSDARSPTTSYIVMSGDLPLSFTIDVGRVSAPQVSSLREATRFTRLTAEVVAQQCKNGNDEACTYMTVEQAAQKILAAIEYSIQAIESRQQVSIGG